jgi:hypothetical protein
MIKGQFQEAYGQDEEIPDPLPDPVPCHVKDFS